MVQEKESCSGKTNHTRGGIYFRLQLLLYIIVDLQTYITHTCFSLFTCKFVFSCTVLLLSRFPGKKVVACC